MKPEFIKYLHCPKTHRALIIKEAILVQGRIKEGMLIEPKSRNTYPVVGFIPRFVPVNNYSASFGFEWATHYNTQYDDITHADVSQRRFKQETGWPNCLKGYTILEIGCGSGRFTKEALKTGAMVVSFDNSSAVDVNYRINGYHPRLFVIQADIYAMPFPYNFFDNVFCFGVLQHTPDPEAAFLNTPKYIKSGGRMVSDIYAKTFMRWVLQPKYWVRPFTIHKNPERLYQQIQKYIDFMWPIARVIRKIPKVGPTLNWKLLIADYSRELPLADDRTLKMWAYLDTFDMLSPLYDNPKTLHTFTAWHKKAKLKDIDVRYGYNGIEGRAIK